MRGRENWNNLLALNEKIFKILNPKENYVKIFFDKFVALPKNFSFLKFAEIKYSKHTII